MQDKKVSMKVFRWVAAFGALKALGLFCATLPFHAVSTVAQDQRTQLPDASAIRAPDSESITGTWKYHFESLSPKITKADCTALVLALSAAREQAPQVAIADMIAEENHFRGLSLKNGRSARRSMQSMLLSVEESKVFYEKTELDGGWQQDASVGFTSQVLRQGDLIWSRQDPSPQSGIVSKFSVSAAHPGQLSTSSDLCAEWQEHFDVVNYCKDNGKSDKSGNLFKVTRSRYLANPPMGIGLIHVGTSMLMRVSKRTGSKSYIVSMFDDTGRSCREWKSLWRNGYPRLLEMRWLFSAGSAVNTVRTLRIVKHSRNVHVPDLQELAVTPFEKRSARDHRQAGFPSFDPFDGVPNQDSVAPDSAENDGNDNGRKIEPSPDDSSPTYPSQSAADQAIPQAGRGAGQGVAPGKQPSPSYGGLDRIPVIPEALAPESNPWVAWAGIIALIVIVVVFLLRRTSGLLMLFSVFLLGCGEASAENGSTRVVTSLDGSAAVEFLPSELGIRRSSHDHETRRYEITLVNNRDYAIDVESVLPTCGCLRLDFESVRIAPFEGMTFNAWVDMDHFRPVNLEAHWRMADTNTESRIATMRLRSVK